MIFFLGGFWIFFFPYKQFKYIRFCIFYYTILIFFLFLLLVLTFNFNSISFYYFIKIQTNVIFDFGLDGINLLFLLLTSFFFPIIILITWSINYYTKVLYFFLYCLEILLICVFSTIDLFSFYIFFELILIPMIFLIAIWGSRYRRIKAIFYFFIYTFAGSLLMLFGLIIIYYKIGNTNFLILSFQVWDFWLEKILWVFFFFSFAIKIPMFPFHIWLPEAHVEAPTFGSILLAALLLKLGGFGFFKILIPFFFHGCLFFLPFIYSLCFLGLLYSSLILLCQIDLKKIIAYSSIAHMNYALLGLFCLNFEAIQGSLFLMISHAFTSGALFFLVGFLYEKLHTRLIFYYHGLVNLMPIFCFFFFFFIFSNFGFPGTANFIGEFLILLNFFNFNNNVFFFLLFSLFLSLIYSILLYIKIFFGELFIFNFFVQNYIDLKKKDFFVLLPLCFFNIFFGIFPNFIFNLLTFNVSLVCCL